MCSTKDEGYSAWAIGITMLSAAKGMKCDTFASEAEGCMYASMFLCSNDGLWFVTLSAADGLEQSVRSVAEEEAKQQHWSVICIDGSS